MAENQQSVLQLEQRVKILSRLAEISLELNSTLELSKLLTSLMKAAIEITEAEAASVLLWEPKTRELRFTTSTSTSGNPALTGQSVPLEGSIAGQALSENRLIQVDNAQQNPQHYAGVDEENRFETRSLLAVPMTIQNRPIGVLEVVNKRQLPWTTEDREFAQVLAAQAAVTIERAQLVAALQQANQELSELDRLKSDFVAIASHELRTPLAIILGYASFLQDDAEGPLGEYINKVVAAALQLGSIIEDLMNLRYLQQSASELNCALVPLAEVLEHALQDITGIAEAKNHQLSITLPDASVLVDVDHARLVMAISNLLNNAVRFTPDGGQITVATERRGDEIWLKITDSGVGLTSDQLERIFEKFYQVEEHTTRRHGGLGIGLPIARALIEAHEGRVWADSPGLGQGTTFTVALPLAESSNAE